MNRIGMPSILVNYELSRRQLKRRGTKSAPEGMGERFIMSMQYAKEETMELGTRVPPLPVEQRKRIGPEVNWIPSVLVVSSAILLSGPVNRDLSHTYEYGHFDILWRVRLYFNDMDLLKVNIILFPDRIINF